MPNVSLISRPYPQTSENIGFASAQTAFDRVYWDRPDQPLRSLLFGSSLRRVFELNCLCLLCCCPMALENGITLTCSQSSTCLKINACEIMPRPMPTTRLIALKSHLRTFSNWPDRPRMAYIYWGDCIYWLGVWFLLDQSDEGIEFIDPR